MFKKITVDGLRGIKNLTIENFKRINLFVGKNNCGKTTILEGLFLITGPTNAELPLKINLFRGLKHFDENIWRLFFNKLQNNSLIKISAELDKPKEKRDLTIKPHTIFTSKEKILRSVPDKESPNSKDIEPSDIKDIFSGLTSTIDGLELEYSFKKEQNKKLLKIITNAIGEGLNVKFLRPQNYEELRRGLFINPQTISGELGTRFDKLQQKKHTSKIFNILKQIEPSLEDLKLGANGIIYCDIGLNRLLPVNVMGDGMHRILSIMLALSDIEGGMIFIDEIENGFHYSSQEILWDAVIKSAIEFNVQVFATTHSIECVKALKACASKLKNNIDNIRLFRIERKKDTFKAFTYDYDTLSASFDSDWEVR